MNRLVAAAWLLLLCGAWLIQPSTPAPPSGLAPGFYVATNGNDSNPGTLASPFLTVQACVNAAEASAGAAPNCYVRSSGAGVYAQPSNTAASCSGNTFGVLINTNNITLQYYPPDGTGTADIDGATNSPQVVICVVNATGVSVIGLKVTAGADSLIRYVTGGSASAGGGTIKWNTLSGVTVGAFGGCIELINNVPNAKIVNNYLSSCPNHGISSISATAGGLSGEVVSGNYIAKQGSSGPDTGAIYFDAAVAGCPWNNVSVTNNYVNTVAKGVYLDDGTCNVTATGNVIVGPTTNDYCFQIHGGDLDVLNYNICDMVGGGAASTSGGIILYQNDNLGNTMGGNKLQSNIIVCNTSGASCGGGIVYTTDAGGPPTVLAASANSYFNYGGGGSVNFACSGVGGCPGDTNAVYQNPALSGYNAVIAPGSPVFNSPVSFQSQGIVGGWGPPGFSVPTSGGVFNPSWLDPAGALLTADRDAYGNWSMAGLQSINGIPTRSTVCATVSARGSGLSDTLNINNAITTCPAGQVVSLPSTLYTVLPTEHIWLNKGITVRGANPPGSTIIENPTSQPAPGTSSYVCPPTTGTYGAIWDCFGGGSVAPIMYVAPLDFNNTDGVTSCALTSDGAKGVYTVSVTSSCISHFSAGQQVLLDQSDATQWMPDTMSPSAPPQGAPTAVVSAFSLASGSWTLVNSVSAGNAATTSTTTSAVSMTGATVLFACVADTDVDPTTGTFSDSSSNSWTKIASYDDTSRGIRTIMYDVTSPTVTGSQTFTYTSHSGTAYAAVGVMGYTGSSPAIDVHNGNIPVSSSTSAAVTVTTTHNGDLLGSCLGVSASNLAGYSLAPSGTALQSITFNSGQTFGLALGSAVQASSGAITMTWTWATAGFAIWANPDYGLVYNIHYPTQGGDDCTATGNPPLPPSNCFIFPDYTINSSRSQNEIKQVLSVDSVHNTVTFDSPLMLKYKVSQTAALWYFATPFLQQAGVENISFLYGAPAIQFQNCAYCWMYRSEVAYSIGQGQVGLYADFRNLLQHNYIHEGAWPEPGGAGYNVALRYDTSEALVTDNISVLDNKSIVFQNAGAGSVVSYNYMDQSYIYDTCCWQEMGTNASHLVGVHHVLIEGNQTANMDSDDTHGGSNYLTFYRNWASSARAPFQGHWDTYFCGYISGTTLTITSFLNSGPNTSGFGALGTLGPNVQIGVALLGPSSCTGSTNTPLASGTQITANGTGNGTTTVVGTYTVNNSQTAGTSGAPIEMIGFAYNQYSDETGSPCKITAGANPLRAAGTQAHSYWQSYVGNYLGISGCTTTANGWSYSPSFTSNTAGMYLLGWLSAGAILTDTIDTTIYPANPPTITCAPNVTSICAVQTASCNTFASNCSTIVTGNWDAVNGMQTWDSRGVQSLPNSFYLQSAPSFFTGFTWPWVVPGTATLNTLPAKHRYDVGGCLTKTFQSGTDCAPF